MKEDNNKTYWPHMIVGFLFMAILLSYWTVKSASSMPVQESNNLMQKYQLVDIHINDILRKREAFDRNFVIDLIDIKRVVVTDNIHSNIVQENPIELKKGLNSFHFIIKNRSDNKAVTLNGAKISFLLTRPHTRVDDILIENIKFKDMSIFVSNIEIEKAGRYTIELKIDYKDTIGYLESSAYLKLKES